MPTQTVLTLQKPVFKSVDLVIGALDLLINGAIVFGALVQESRRLGRVVEKREKLVRNPVLGIVGENTDHPGAVGLERFPEFFLIKRNIERQIAVEILATRYTEVMLW